MDGSAIAITSEKPTAEVYEHLASELDRYERILHMTESLLHPVLLGDERGDATSPQEAPMHDYHRMVYRLKNLNDRAENLRSRIRV